MAAVRDLQEQEGYSDERVSLGVLRKVGIVCIRVLATPGGGGLAYSTLLNSTQHSSLF